MESSRVTAILIITVAGISSNDLSIFRDFEIIGGARRRGVLFATLCICLMLEHALLYCLVRWVWALPPTSSYQHLDFYSVQPSIYSPTFYPMVIRGSQDGGPHTIPSPVRQEDITSMEIVHEQPDSPVTTGS